MGKQNAAAELRRVIAKYGFNRTLDIEMGTVIDDRPLGIILDGSDIVIRAQYLILLEHVTKYEVEIELDGVLRTATVNGALKQADRVVVVYDADQAKFIVLDRAMYGTE